MTDPPVTFLFPGGERALDGIEVDRDWTFFGSGLRAWIAQTYLRLRAAGHRVDIASRPPERGIVVYHPDYLDSEGSADLFGQAGTVTVGVRADRRPQDRADFEVLQNSCFADGLRQHFMTHWSQPGLVPRDPDRGSRLRTLAFKGHDLELHPDLRSERWQRFCERRGFRWVVDAASFQGPSVGYDTVQWNDYREVDLVIALRPRERALSMATPATKLYNAWTAGVPAALGPERAYRELRRSSLDYVEVDAIDGVVEAIDGLSTDGARYRAMVDNGLERSREFSCDRTVARWAELLFETVPRLAAHPRVRARRRVPAAGLVLARKIRERLIGARARWQLRLSPVGPALPTEE